MDENSMHEGVLPGFRFHPTEEELLDFYLKRTSMGKTICSHVISFLNIYHHDPSELPGLAKTGEREWYFFVHRDRKHGHGGRPGRTTEHGFWKATGSDRHIRSVSEPKKVLGLKKTLVFYRGRAPRGIKTDWIMNEYRLPDKNPMPKEDIVLCKIYRKATSLKILEQRAAMEDHKFRTISPMSSSPPSQDTSEDRAYELCYDKTTSSEQMTVVEDCKFRTISTMSSSPPSQNTSEDRGYETWFDKTISSLPQIDFDDCDLGIPNPPIEFGYAANEVGELEVPAFTGDPFSTPLRNVWMDQWSPYTNILDF